MVAMLPKGFREQVSWKFLVFQIQSSVFFPDSDPGASNGVCRSITTTEYIAPWVVIWLQVDCLHGYFQSLLRTDKVTNGSVTAWIQSLEFCRLQWYHMVSSSLVKWKLISMIALQLGKHLFGYMLLWADCFNQRCEWLYEIVVPGHSDKVCHRASSVWFGISTQHCNVRGE